MCNRCHGFMVRQLQFEHETGSSPCYGCVNCGNYVDPVINRNKAMSPQERANLRLHDAEVLNYVCL